MNKLISFFAKPFHKTSHTSSSGKPSARTVSQPHEALGIPSIVVVTMTVSGRRADLESYRLAVGQCVTKYYGVGEYSDFSLDAILPLPKDAVALIQRTQSLIALEALCKSHWGVVSEAKGVSLREFDHKHKLRFTFSVFDELPLKVLTVMAERFHHLNFHIEYKNERRGYHGVAISRCGRLYSWRRELFVHERRRAA